MTEGKLSWEDKLEEDMPVAEDKLAEGKPVAKDRLEEGKPVAEDRLAAKYRLAMVAAQEQELEWEQCAARFLRLESLHQNLFR